MSQWAETKPEPGEAMIRAQYVNNDKAFQKRMAGALLRGREKDPRAVAALARRQIIAARRGKCSTS